MMTNSVVFILENISRFWGGMFIMNLIRLGVNHIIRCSSGCRGLLGMLLL